MHVMFQVSKDKKSVRISIYNDSAPVIQKSISTESFLDWIHDSNTEYPDDSITQLEELIKVADTKTGDLPLLIGKLKYPHAITQLERRLKGEE